MSPIGAPGGAGVAGMMRAAIVSLTPRSRKRLMSAESRFRWARSDSAMLVTAVVERLRIRSSFSDAIARDTSRRGFLARVGGALVALTAARTVGTLIEPGDSEAFHFCGHTFTTGSCPHPTGLPRIDSRGFPLAADERPEFCFFADHGLSS